MENKTSTEAKSAIAAAKRAAREQLRRMNVAPIDFYGTPGFLASIYSSNHMPTRESGLSSIRAWRVA